MDEGEQQRLLVPDANSQAERIAVESSADLAFLHQFLHLKLPAAQIQRRQVNKHLRRGRRATAVAQSEIDPESAPMAGFQVYLNGRFWVSPEV